MLNGQYKVKTRSVKSAAGTDVTGEPWRNGTSAPAYKMCGTSRSSLAPRKQSPCDNASACVPTRSQPVNTACKSDTESVQAVAFCRKTKNWEGLKKKKNTANIQVFSACLHWGYGVNNQIVLHQLMWKRIILYYLTFFFFFSAWSAKQYETGYCECPESSRPHKNVMTLIIV